MSAMQPGWYPDPYGRFARRYHDGRGWTEHVADQQGAQRTDAVPGPEPTPTPAASGGGTNWAQPTTASWQAPSSAGAAPPASPSAPAFGQPGLGTQQLPTTPAAPGWGATAAPTSSTTAGRKGGAGWIGVLLALAGAALVVVGLFALDWLAIAGQDGNRSEVNDLVDFIDEQGGSANLLSTTWFSFGWIVGLVVAGLAVIAALVLKAPLRIIAAVLALVVLAWALFGWLNLRAYVNNEANSEALGFGGESFSAEIGGWLTVAGFALLALGALLGGALARRRQR